MGENEEVGLENRLLGDGGGGVDAGLGRSRRMTPGITWWARNVIAQR